MLVLTLSIAGALDVTVDGQREGIEVVASFAGGEHVVRIGEFVLWLDESHAWKLERKLHEQTLVMLTEKGRPVGAVLGAVWNGKHFKPHNPLAGFSDLSSLRGVHVTDDLESTAAALTRLSGDHLCFSLMFASTVERLPRIPQRVPCISLQTNGLVHATVQLLARVRYASVAGEPDALSFGPAVEVLDLYSTVRKPAALTRLKALRTLSLSGTGVVLSGEFSALESLTIQERKLTSLVQLVAPKLRELRVSSTPLTELPPHLPSLTLLRALSTGLSAQTLKTFSDAHPLATIQSGWVPVLRAALEGVTRVRVRSGGLCHSNPAEERTLLDVSVPAEIAEFIDTIAIDESASDGACMCCGAPTIEFYRGEALVSAVGVQHGAAVRWGDWPADGMLANDSFVRWLAAHGVTAPLEELQQAARRDAARSALRERYERLLPRSVLEGLLTLWPSSKAFDSGVETTQLSSLLEGAVPGADERTVIYLRLLAARMGAWSTSGGIDAVVNAALEATPAAMLAKAMASPNQDVLEGAARFLIGGRRVELAAAPELAPFIPMLARKGLTADSVSNRWSTLVLLAAVRTQATTDVLRELVRGALVASRSTKEADDDSSWVQFGPDPLAEALEKSLAKNDAGLVNVREALSLQAIAATLLAGRNDVASAEAIQALAQTASGLDAFVLRGARKWAETSLRAR